MSPRMHRTESRRPRLYALITVVALGLMAAPAVIAAPSATEEVISVHSAGRQPDVLDTIVTRLTVPPQAVWETDPAAGPLSLRVETGVLGVMLGGGSARIERQANPLMAEQLDEQIMPLPPGRTALLRAGDRLVIVRGFQLTVTNDEERPAIAIVRRLQPESDLWEMREPSAADLREMREASTAAP